MERMNERCANLGFLIRDIRVIRGFLLRINLDVAIMPAILSGIENHRSIFQITLSLRFRQNAEVGL